MKLGFYSEEWTHLQKLYGTNVFDNEFFVEDIYFQKWITPQNIMGYCIHFVVILQKKPIFTLKNWENEEQIRIHFQFDGGFKLGLFRFSNRKLLHLKQKSVKFQFTENELHGHKEILILSKNKEFIFYARSFFANVSKIFCK